VTGQVERLSDDALSATIALNIDSPLGLQAYNLIRLQIRGVL
jgi:hypothetical protein